MAQKAKIITLRIELEEIVPPIWRRIAVDADITLRELHHVIQAAFGWADAHLHEFTIEGRPYVMFDNPNVLEYIEQRSDKPLDDRKTKLQKLARAGLAFDYQYDFGDRWLHKIKIEEIEASAEQMGSAHIIDGQRACPPEDVGGTPGYEDFLREIQDPSSEQGRDYLRWVGGEFDPEQFDRRSANNTLLRMAWNGWGKI